MTTTGLSGRVALVTGGSRGIGQAVCLALAGEGARVAINYTTSAAAAQGVKEAVEALGATAMTVRADVSREDEVARMVAEVEAGLGPVDLLAANAGLASVEARGEVAFEDWRRLFATNVDGVLLSIMAVKDGMLARGYGRIVCTASIAGLRPRPRMIAYGTSKAAVIALTRNCAAAFGPNVRVNAVAPGLIETDMTADMSPEMLDAMKAEAVLERHGRPEEIADAVVYLMSDRSSFMSGQTLVVDGGRVTLP